MFQLPGSNDEAHIHYSLLQRYGYEPLIEERVRTFPLRDPATGELLNWRVRMYISEGKPAGMYACATPHELPVGPNATPFSLGDLERYTDDPDTPQLLLRKLDDTALALASLLPQGVGGCDVLIDQDVERVLLEVNVGQIGGLGVIASGDTFDQKLQPLNVFIDSWLPRLYTARVKAASQPIDIASLEANVVGVFRGLYDLGSLDMLAQLPEEEVRAFGNTHFERYLWCYARVYSGEPIESVVDDLLRLAPLEFATHAEKIVTITGASATLSENLEALSMLLPQEWRHNAGEEALLQTLRDSLEREGKFV